MSFNNKQDNKQQNNEHITYFLAICSDEYGAPYRGIFSNIEFAIGFMQPKFFTDGALFDIYEVYLDDPTREKLVYTQEGPVANSHWRKLE